MKTRCPFSHMGTMVLVCELNWCCLVWNKETRFSHRESDTNGRDGGRVVGWLSLEKISKWNKEVRINERETDRESYNCNLSCNWRSISMEYFLNLYFWVTLENNFKKTQKTWIWGNTKLLDKVFIDLMFLFLSNILQPFLFSFVFWPMCHLDLLLRYMLILYGWHWRMSLPLVLCVIVLNWWCTFFM